MKWLFTVIGAIAILLGGLWLVQGLGLVTIPPILCVADCETLQGPAPEWAVAGGVLLLAGVGVVWWALRRR
jgi:hypothetical protein